MQISPIKKGFIFPLGKRISKGLKLLITKLVSDKHFLVKRLKYLLLSNSRSLEDVSLFEQLKIYEARGAFNSFFYSGENCASVRRFHSNLNNINPNLKEIADSKYANDTAQIIARYLNNVPASKHFEMSYFPYSIAEQYIASRSPICVASNKTSTFSIVTSFYGSIQHFASAANSVALMWLHNKEIDFEWIINNDSTISNDRLEHVIPGSIRSFVTVFNGIRNYGVCNGLNEAIKKAKNEWLLFLDCDDQIEAISLEVLQHYISEFPKVRYFSSGIIDIDENGNILRYRRHEYPASQLLEKGMLAGHLKAIRADAFQDHGLLDAHYNLSQDFEFAVRFCLVEPIVLIPEYLYRYRWHERSQSILNAVKQHDAFRRIVYKGLEVILSPHSSNTEVYAVPKRRSSGKGGCIIRTQSQRLDLLPETIDSVLLQSPIIEPIVVVHGDENTFNIVRNFCSVYGERVNILHATNTEKLRGYPANVGLQHVTKVEGEYGFICFLDDDDIYYSNFSARKLEAARLSGADVVYSSSNRRVPWVEQTPGPVLLPSGCLVAGNFITINSYILSVDFVRETGVRFNENMEYLEDWMFLISLLKNKAKFYPLFETLSEFRITSDGNTEVKRFPDLYQECQGLCFAEGLAAAEYLGPLYFLHQLRSFDFSRAGRLGSGEKALINSACRMFFSDKICAELFIK